MSRGSYGFLQRKSLSSRLLFIALPLVSLFSLALFVVFGYVSYTVLRDDLTEKIEQTADINARVLATRLLPAAAGKAFDAFLENELARAA